MEYQVAEIGKSAELEPLIVPRPEHSVSRAKISKNALKVLYRLKDAGHQACLVGGGVRDLLLGREPKDFDVATDARPEQVRALFSNCRLIGRRFRLAHIRFGREIIEVATFRASTPANGSSDSDGQVFHESGRIISDNVYGTIEEDALRRDFTINALYYNIADYSIWAFADGLEDIRVKRIRLIGDPAKRYTEDPVRMLRAARFAAKLDFKIDAAGAEPIPAMASLLDDVPPARLFDEFLKLFQSGHAAKSFYHLRGLGLFRYLFPDTDRCLEANAQDEDLIQKALINTDERIAAGKSVTPMFMFGVFLWGPVRERAVQIREEDESCSEMQALIAAIGEVASRQAQRIALPRRFGFPMREMLQLQPRFSSQRGRRAMNLLNHRRFRAAYDLMMLRAEVGEVDQETAAFWTQVQELPEEEQRQRFGLGKRQRRPARKRRRPNKTG